MDLEMSVTAISISLRQPQKKKQYTLRQLELAKMVTLHCISLLPPSTPLQPTITKSDTSEDVNFFGLA